MDVTAKLLRYMSICQIMLMITRRCMCWLLAVDSQRWLNAMLMRSGMSSVISVEPHKHSFNDEGTCWVTNRSRWKLCFADFAREPEYEEKNGRVRCWLQWCTTHGKGNQDKKKLQEVISRDDNTLLGEASVYFDANKCSVGFHGDTHTHTQGRRQDLGVRLGCSMPLEYQW